MGEMVGDIDALREPPATCSGPATAIVVDHETGKWLGPAPFVPGS
jgi:hypothetical protein